MESPFRVLVKPLFKSFVAFLILCTAANSDVLSANSFRLHWRPSDESLIWIKNKRGPKIDPCGTPVRTSLQDKCWPFRTDHLDHLDHLDRFLDFKKSVKIFKSGPPILFCFNLWMRPLCQTLSKVYFIFCNMKTH